MKPSIDYDVILNYLTINWWKYTMWRKVIEDQNEKKRETILMKSNNDDGREESIISNTNEEWQGRLKPDQFRHC